MKKIKYIFGIGVLGFFLSSCFSYTVKNVDIISTSVSNNNSVVSRNYYGNCSYSSNGNYLLGVSSDYSYCLYDNFSNSSFNCSPLLNSGLWFGSLTSSSYFTSEEGFSGFNDPGFPSMCVYQNWGFSYTNSVFNGSVYHGSQIGNNYGYLKWGPFDSSIAASTVSVSNPGFVRLIYDSSSDFNVNPGYENLSSNISRYYYFDSEYLRTNTNNHKDVPTGYVKYKIFNNIDYNYSYIALNTGNNSLLFQSTNSSILFSDGFSAVDLTGYLLLNFIDYNTLGLTGNSSIVLSLSGNKVIFNFYYDFCSSINCLSSKTPASVGYLSYNGSINNAYTGLYDFTISNGLFFDVVGSYQNGLNLRRYSLNQRIIDGNPTPITDYLFTFEEDSSVPVIIPGGGNGGTGNQSTGNVEPIFDYNTSLISDLIICYITSGDICVYDSFDRSAFESSFDVSDSVWNGTTGFLLGGNAYLFLKEFCLNSSFIDYAFCSQLDIYSGSVIFIDYSDGLLSYEILGDSVIVSIGGLGSGQLGSVSCWGGGCSNINTGLPTFIRPSSVDYYSGSFIDTGYFEDFYNLNITGYFMRCPFSYNSNRIVIGKKIMDYLGDRDPFVFINCMIAGFNEGKSFSFLDRLDFPGPLMSLGSDYNVLGFDTDKNKRLLFGFFDLLLSFGLLLLIRVFYRLFS